jgi:threonine dehydrogenase-like Zn-dependent dehydrogenase
LFPLRLAELGETEASVANAIAAARPGGRVRRVGGPHYPAIPGVETWVRKLLPEVVRGTINPGRVFDHTVDLAGVPDGYQAMAERSALKVMIAPQARCQPQPRTPGRPASEQWLR